MAGVKGRSGRKSKRDEQKRLEIIERAWDLVREKLFAPGNEKFKIACEIALKDMTTKIEGTGVDAVRIFNILREIRGDKEVGSPSLGVDNRHCLDEGRTRLTASDKEVPE